jgi:hypothetical protein
MFTPSREQVRLFFCDIWHKHHTHHSLTPLESLAWKWMVAHPEYHALLADKAAALAQDFSIETDQTNPFLHLAMHLSISEQISIDQPSGIRHLSIGLIQKLDSEHTAHHYMMECLGETLWNSQRNNMPLDSNAYLACIEKQLSRLGSPSST